MTSLACEWHLKWSGGKPSCGVDPLTCGVWRCLWVDSVRIEVGAGVRELLVGVGRASVCLVIGSAGSHFFFV